MDEPAEKTNGEDHDFPIVGIGASAGGLEAISALLARVPADCGFGIVIVQHLDPKRESTLAETIGFKTTLPVEQATDGKRVEPNHVYVIPPNKSMTVSQGHLKLTPRDAHYGPPMPIDDLLESLAKDQGSNAIGVILSGMGSDGALGMAAVKEYGGTTFAQNDSSARYSSMPHAAISLRSVDLVLTPDEIGNELLRIARNLYSLPEMTASHLRGTPSIDESMKRIFRLLRLACNLDFSHYKRGTVSRRLARRLALHSAADLEAYVDILEGDPSEAHALCRDILIKYTEFFRDTETFDVLKETVFPRILEGGTPNTPIRIWVPGCATGEEVYSITICLLEYLGMEGINRPIQVFGTDVSEDALEVARGGRYIENIARTVSPERLQRFFVKEGDRYRVVKSVRDICTFARQNVAYDPPFSRVDLLSCRNLLIYLDPILQKRVMPTFHFALQRNGVLMLGLSETVGAYSELFSVIESKRGRLFVKKPVPSRPYIAFGPQAHVPTSTPMTRPAPPGGNQDAPAADQLRREADRIALNRYAPACVLCDAEFNVQEFRGDTSPFLSHPPGLPTSQLQRLVRPGLFLAISEAVRQVANDGMTVRKVGLRTEINGRMCEAAIEVVPVQTRNTEGRWFLVFFEEIQPAAVATIAAGQATLWQQMKAAISTRIATNHAKQSDDEKNTEIARLNAELIATREQIRIMLDEHESALEELKSIEEETLSSNEEFQSTNEELETAKEELQSVNEELSTTNDELRFRNREIKESHDETTRARDFADAIIETMAEPLVVLDLNFRVMRANRAFYETFKVKSAETVNASLFSLGQRQWDAPLIRELLDELVPEQPKMRDQLFTSEFPDIGRRTFRVNAVRVAAADHSFILMTLEDITVRQEIIERLRQGDRQKDEFIAMLAHELRNPLAAIMNALNIWKRSDKNPKATADAQAMLDRQLKTQVRLVDDLLDISRMTRGLVTLSVEKVDMVGAIHAACDALKPTVEAYQHDLELILPETPLLINGDRIRLEQIITNVVGNAIKYTPRGGQITLIAKRIGKQIVVEVTDRGIGMAADLLPKIFDVFVQAERTMDRSHGGLGMGLTVVKRLVELHGGTIAAFSDGLTKGSRFVIRLPAVDVDQLPTPDSKTDLDNSNLANSNLANSNLAGTDLANIDLAKTEIANINLEPKASGTRRVLVVDDNIDAAQGTAMLLGLEGHEVELAFDGISALEKMQQFKPDVVLMDIGLPGMDGYAVCKELRKMPQYAQTVLVALSGYGQAENIKRSAETGFDFHLTKPATAEQLSRCLATVH